MSLAGIARKLGGARRVRLASREKNRRRDRIDVPRVHEWRELVGAAVQGRYRPRPDARVPWRRPSQSLAERLVVTAPRRKAEWRPALRALGSQAQVELATPCSSRASHEFARQRRRPRGPYACSVNRSCVHRNARPPSSVRRDRRRRCPTRLSSRHQLAHTDSRQRRRRASGGQRRSPTGLSRIHRRPRALDRRFGKTLISAAVVSTSAPSTNGEYLRARDAQLLLLHTDPKPRRALTVSLRYPVRAKRDSSTAPVFEALVRHSLVVEYRRTSPGAQRKLTNAGTADTNDVASAAANQPALRHPKRRSGSRARRSSAGSNQSRVA